jgi:hypothetical protein
VSKEVREEIELHLIDTSQLVEEAKKIRAAQALARQATAAKKQLAAGLSPFGRAIPQNIQANLPKGFFTGAEQTFRSAVSGGRTDNAFKQLQDQNKKLEDMVKKSLANQKEMEEKWFGNAKNIGSIAIGATSLPSGILSLIGKFGAIGALIAGVASLTIDEVTRQFERGGIFSTKLKRLKQASTLEDVENDNAYRAGTKYITSDLRVAQKSPEDSNTANIKYEFIRYTLENAGKI